MKKSIIAFVFLLHTGAVLTSGTISKQAYTKFAKMKVARTLMFDLIAQDGSIHKIFGTVHNGVDINTHFAPNSRLYEALRDSTRMIREEPGIDDMPNDFLKEMRLYRHGEGETIFDLRTQLGEEYWQRMASMFWEYPEVFNVHNRISLEQFLQVLTFSHPMRVIDLLNSGEVYAYGYEKAGVALDDQIAEIGRSRGLHSIWLQTIEQAAETARDYMLAVRAKADVADVKEFIDKNGIVFSAQNSLAERTAYFQGDEKKLLESYRTSSTALSQKEDRMLLYERNKMWIENGVIQENCRRGERCFIFVGYLHLLKGENNLINLLQQEGFTIKRTAPDKKRRRGKRSL